MVEYSDMTETGLNYLEQFLKDTNVNEAIICKNKIQNTERIEQFN